MLWPPQEVPPNRASVRDSSQESCRPDPPNQGNICLHHRRPASVRQSRLHKNATVPLLQLSVVHPAGIEPTTLAWMMKLVSKLYQRLVLIATPRTRMTPGHLSFFVTGAHPT
jgi:hypothetical protein